MAIVIFCIRQVNGETGRYTIFTFVCLSVTLCVHTQSHWFEWAEWRVVRREMYSTRVWKVDTISVRTKYCWKRRFIGFLMSFSRSKWGLRRNVQKCNTKM